MTTRYISPSGNDTTGDGTQSLPWLTFTKAHTSSVNGDTIICATGAYSDATYFTHSKNLTWSTDGGLVTYSTDTTINTLFINGSNDTSFTGITFDGNDDTNSIVTADGSDTVSFIDCVFTGSSTNINNNLVNGNGTVVGETANWTFDGCTFVSNGASFFDLDAFSNIVVNNCSFSGTYRFIALDTADTSGSITFTNNTITADTTDGRFAIITSTNITSVVFTGNTITTTAISIGTLKQVVIEDIPIVNVSDNIFNNLALTTAKATEEIKIDSPGGVAMAVTVSGNTIYDRTITTTTAIIVGKDSSSAGNTLLNGAVISGNTLYQAGFYGETFTGQRHAIELGFSTGTVSNNYVNGSYWACVLKGGPGGVATDWTGAGGFYGNTCVDCNDVAFLNVKGISNTFVGNNIFINLGAETLSGGMVYVNENSAEIGSVPQNIDIKNNVFYQEIGVVKSVYVGDATTVFTMDNSVHYSGDSSGFSMALIGRVGTPYSTSANWQAEGYDVNFLSEANPDFTDLISFIPSETSPCIGNGSRWWTGANPAGSDGEPFSDFDTDIGDSQSTYSDYHPSNL